jgi:hypothetical protein
MTYSCSSSQIQFPQHSVLVTFFVFPQSPHRATGFALDGFAGCDLEALGAFFFRMASS